jgi:SAM-dependent methyltransferase
MSDYAVEVERGERFAFGANWARFLSSLNEARIEEARTSLRTMLGVQTLQGQTFLDVGSGSGLFSLAARSLGAQVVSFDYDQQSVACTTELRRRYFPDQQWRVESGSVLDQQYLARLGQFDVVYSWGVLHHTGRMWDALGNVVGLVKPGGRLFIAIYNRQPFLSSYWTFVKRCYNRCWRPLRWLMSLGFFAFFAIELFVADAVRGISPARRYRGTGHRGMSLYYDVVDWIGGFPFEVASPEEILRFYRQRGFELTELTTCAGKQGCNQFVFTASRVGR